MHHGVLVGLARAQYHVWPTLLALLVDAVWEGLGFQAQRIILAVRRPVLAGNAVQKVARVELDSRLIAGHGHGDSGLRAL